MNQTQRKQARGLTVATVTGALALGLAGGGAASAEDAGTAGEPATITMNFKRGKFSFSGAKQVTAGENLRIRNSTNPRSGGPHTFTLVKRSLLPKSQKARKRCGMFAGVCGDVARAHQVNPKTFKVGRPLFKAGKPGWNKVFTAKSAGDTWYSETVNETFSQRVSASAAGKSLSYLCVVHPEMQGQIKVVAAE